MNNNNEFPRLTSLLESSPSTVNSSTPPPPYQVPGQARTHSGVQFAYPLSPEQQTQKLLNKIFGFVKPILGLQLVVDGRQPPETATQSHADNVANYEFLKGQWKINKNQFGRPYQVFVDRLLECTDDILQKKQNMRGTALKTLFLSFGLVLGFAGMLARKKTYSWTLGSLVCMGISLMISEARHRAFSKIQEDAKIIYTNLRTMGNTYHHTSYPHITIMEIR